MATSAESAWHVGGNRARQPVTAAPARRQKAPGLPVSSGGDRCRGTASDVAATAADKRAVARQPPARPTRPSSPAATTTSMIGTRRNAQASPPSRVSSASAPGRTVDSGRPVPSPPSVSKQTSTLSEASAAARRSCRKSPPVAGACPEVAESATSGSLAQMDSHVVGPRVVLTPKLASRLMTDVVEALVVATSLEAAQKLVGQRWGFESIDEMTGCIEAQANASYSCRSVAAC